MSKKSIGISLAEANLIHKKALKRLHSVDKNRSLFSVQLAAICSEEIAEADGDLHRLIEAMQELVNVLAFTIAVGGRGHPATMDKALQAVEAQLYKDAAGYAKAGARQAKGATIKDEDVSGT